MINLINNSFIEVKKPWPPFKLQIVVFDRSSILNKIKFNVPNPESEALM